PGMPVLMETMPWSVVYVCLPYFGWGFQGVVTVVGGSKFYAAEGLGVGLKVGQQIVFLGFSNATNNGLKTITTISDNVIGVNEACVSQDYAQNITMAWKLFSVANRRVDPDGGLLLELLEYSDEIYSLIIDPTKFPAPTDLPLPFSLTPPENVTAEE